MSRKIFSFLLRKIFLPATFWHIYFLIILCYYISDSGYYFSLLFPRLFVLENKGGRKNPPLFIS